MENSVSWIGFGLSALLIVDKFITKNRLKKCKCCGACFEFEGLPDPSSPKNKHDSNLPTIEIQNIDKENRV
jgi:hypothetical protein